MACGSSASQLRGKANTYKCKLTMHRNTGLCEKRQSTASHGARPSVGLTNGMRGCRRMIEAAKVTAVKAVQTRHIQAKPFASRTALMSHGRMKPPKPLPGSRAKVSLAKEERSRCE